VGVGELVVVVIFLVWEKLLKGKQLGTDSPVACICLFTKKEIRVMMFSYCCMTLQVDIMLEAE
jgi:hypothetical protein